MDSTEPYILVVTRGPDEGARLEVGPEPRVIGRSRESALVLTDLAVSRRHFDAWGTPEGIAIRALPQTSPLLVDQKSVREGTAPVGSTITVGNTVLSVLSCPPLDIAFHASEERAEAHTLLHGSGSDVMGLAAMAALMEWLDNESDREGVERVMAKWSFAHADAHGFQLHLEEEPAHAEACEVHKQTAHDVVIRSRSFAATDVVVPAHARGRAWLTFSFKRPASTVGESTRRLLLVAGRVCASALSRIETVRVARDQYEEARQAAVGRARCFLGTSPQATKLAALISKVATSDVVVLFQGETGVGKSFAARLIHESSDRAHEPLRILNCASIPESLLESELFGHEKGAFTGATSTREGALEAVGRGTLFLDEIGELSLASQAKLLRVLEEKRFERVGSNRTLQLRARVVCATNRDLDSLIKEGRFRHDLYFRISVVTLSIPPLRERGEDLPLLAEQILTDLLPSAGRRVEGFTRDALDAIRQYAWPGNVRELRNAIEYALVLGTGDRISSEDFPETIGALVRPPEPPVVEPMMLRDGSDTLELPAPMAKVERFAIHAALRATGGNRTRAAALLGMHRTTLTGKFLSDE